MNAKRLNENHERHERHARRAAPSFNDATLIREVVADLRARHERLSVAAQQHRTRTNELERSIRARETERRRYQDLFNFTPDALFVSDPRGTVREANAAAAELIGVGSRVLRGRPLEMFLREGDSATFRDALAAVARGDVIDVDVVFEANRDRRVNALVHGSKTHDPKRYLWRASVMNVESAVAQRTKALERALREKDLSLDCERKSREELETASNAKDRSIAILSHELRVPVHAILGWTKLLRQTDIGADTRERGLTVIERNALAQSELVERLLDLSRIVANKLTLAQDPVDLGDVVSLAVDALRPEACRKRIALSSEIHRGAHIHGDALRLQQVAMNLVSNAVRYTPAGGWVGVRVDRNAGDATLVVSDSGRGISSDLMPRIFDCFQQGAALPGQGLGLGLYLVRKFIQMHGGAVWAVSGGDNRGATFTVVLPAVSHCDRRADEGRR